MDKHNLVVEVRWWGQCVGAQEVVEEFVALFLVGIARLVHVARETDECPRLHKLVGFSLDCSRVMARGFLVGVAEGEVVEFHEHGVIAHVAVGKVAEHAEGGT